MTPTELEVLELRERQSFLAVERQSEMVQYLKEKLSEDENLLGALKKTWELARIDLANERTKTRMAKELATSPVEREH